MVRRRERGVRPDTTTAGRADAWLLSDYTRSAPLSGDLGEVTGEEATGLLDRGILAPKTRSLLLVGLNSMNGPWT